MISTWTTKTSYSEIVWILQIIWFKTCHKNDEKRQILNISERSKFRIRMKELQYRITIRASIIWQSLWRLRLPRRQRSENQPISFHDFFEGQNKKSHNKAQRSLVIMTREATYLIKARQIMGRRLVTLLRILARGLRIHKVP